jgi:3-dehydroquinate dehydratase II
MSNKYLIINGPNLNMLGKREPEIYGKDSLDDVRKYTETLLVKNFPKVSTEWFQSNIEGEIVSKIQSLHNSEFKGLIINPGAYSHTSVAILDALKILKIPIVEVHLSNTHAREEFRAKRLSALQATIVLEGLGKKAYYVGLLSLLLD